MGEKIHTVTKGEKYEQEIINNTGKNVYKREGEKITAITMIKHMLVEE